MNTSIKDTGVLKTKWDIQFYIEKPIKVCHKK